jgi:hypothetical protein
MVRLLGGETVRIEERAPGACEKTPLRPFTHILDPPARIDGCRAQPPLVIVREV